MFNPKNKEEIFKKWVFMIRYRIIIYLDVPAIRYFFKQDAQPTWTVHDILRKSELFKVKEGFVMHLLHWRHLPRKEAKGNIESTTFTGISTVIANFGWTLRPYLERPLQKVHCSRPTWKLRTYYRWLDISQDLMKSSFPLFAGKVDQVCCLLLS